jgi:hypothetical protein
MVGKGGFAISSLSHICSFSFMGGVGKKVHDQTWM